MFVVLFPFCYVYGFNFDVIVVDSEWLSWLALEKGVVRLGEHYIFARECQSQWTN